MGKSAARFEAAAAPAKAEGARVIDIRTRKPWRPPPRDFRWAFAIDAAITILMVLLGAWLFIKMRGG